MKMIRLYRRMSSIGLLAVASVSMMALAPSSASAFSNAPSSVNGKCGAWEWQYRDTSGPSITDRNGYIYARSCIDRNNGKVRAYVETKTTGNLQFNSIKHYAQVWSGPKCKAITGWQAFRHDWWDGDGNAHYYIATAWQNVANTSNFYGIGQIEYDVKDDGKGSFVIVAPGSGTF